MMRHLLPILLFALLITSCGGQAAPTSASSGPIVLTSTPWLADVTRSIAGDRLQVESLLPDGSDPHSYQPTPQDAARVSGSKLIIVNGAGYEQFLNSLLENAGVETTVVEASKGVSPGEEAGSIDPHMWLDPNNMVAYTENIRDA